jgi:cell division protein YceG involved in septum cleavage
MMAWESGLGSIKPFAQEASITPINYSGYDQILSGVVTLIESSEPDEPAKYVLEGWVLEDRYRATISSTRMTVIAELINITTGQAEHLSCKDDF